MAEMRLLQWETPQCSLEGIKGCVGSWVSRKLFQSLMVFGKNEAEYAEASVCDLCYRDLWSLEFIVFCCFDVDQVVMDLVHHHQAAVESTILERWPVESAHHICHATGAVVISNNKSNSNTAGLVRSSGYFCECGDPKLRKPIQQLAGQRCCRLFPSLVGCSG